MKNKIIFSIAFIAILGISLNVNANPHRGCYHRFGSRFIPRVWVPPVRIVTLPVVYGGYYGSAYYPTCPPPRYYYHPHCRGWYR